jgi:hypothetical protein
VVATRLEPDVLGRPHLVFHRGKAPETTRELESYVWNPNQSDMPLKKDDHGCDGLRYGVVGISRLYGLALPFEDEQQQAA